MSIRASVGAVALSFFLSGCMSAGSQGPTNQAVGTGIGAAGGAVIGAVLAKNLGVSPVLGAVVGGLAGGVIGNSIGSSLDEQERQQLAGATQRAAATGRIGQRVTWAGSRSKPAKPKKAKDTNLATNSQTTPAASGWVVPTTENYLSSDGRTCRDLEQIAIKDGKTLESKVTACRTGSGWEVPNAA